MIDDLVTILCGLAVIAVAGAAVWAVMEARESRRREREKEADKQTQRDGGGGGPTPTR